MEQLRVLPSVSKLQPNWRVQNACRKPYPMGSNTVMHLFKPWNIVCSGIISKSSKYGAGTAVLAQKRLKRMYQHDRTRCGFSLLFRVADAAGNLKDTSNADTVKWLQKNGYTVYPLVSNQFNSSLTTQFLADSAAQDKFIKALVDRSVQLGVPGSMWISKAWLVRIAMRLQPLCPN